MFLAADLCWLGAGTFWGRPGADSTLSSGEHSVGEQPAGEGGRQSWLRQMAFPLGLQGHLKVDEQDSQSMLSCLSPMEWLSLSGESKPSGSACTQQCSPVRWSPTVIDSRRSAELPHRPWQCCPLVQFWGGKHYYLIKKIFLSDHLAPEFLLRTALTLLGGGEWWIRGMGEEMPKSPLCEDGHSDGKCSM